VAPPILLSGQGERRKENSDSDRDLTLKISSKEHVSIMRTQSPVAIFIDFWFADWKLMRGIELALLGKTQNRLLISAANMIAH
jgi:hypothetical protein